MTEQQKAFWDLLDIFDKEGLLPYIMLIGSWAEYIYQLHMESGYTANLKTRDVDFLYPNLNQPKGREIRIRKSMEEKGFLYTEDYISGVGKYIKEDLLELEFMTRALGQGQSVNIIPSLNIKAEGLRDVNVLASYPLRICSSALKDGYDNLMITVPEPEAYVIQKLLINTKRTPEHKREKDIQSVRELLNYIDIDRIAYIFKSLTKKQQSIIEKTREKHFIEFGG